MSCLSMLRSFFTIRLCFLVVWTIFSISISKRGDYSEKTILAIAYAHPQLPGTISNDPPNIPNDKITDGDYDDAVVVINGLQYSMPVGTEIRPAYSRQIAEMPITVQTATISRAPPNYGCFLSSTPEYLRRVYETENPLERRKVSKDGNGDGESIISKPFYSPETRFGSTNLVSPFENAIILTCYRIFNRTHHYTYDPDTNTDNLATVDTDESDVLLVWLEFANSRSLTGLDPNLHDLAPLITAGKPNADEAESPSSFDPAIWDWELHGYGSLHYIFYRKHRGVFGERRFGETFVGDSPALERAAVVHDPLTLARTGRDAGDEDTLNSDDIGDDSGTECLAVGKREGEKEDRTRDDYIFGIEKGVFYVDEPLVGTFQDVDGIICYQGRRANGFEPEEITSEAD